MSDANYYRQYYKKNKQKCLEKSRRYKAKNKDKYKLFSKLREEKRKPFYSQLWAKRKYKTYSEAQLLLIELAKELRKQGYKFSLKH